MINGETRIGVVGIVTARNDQGVRVQVPFGEYTMTKKDGELFVLTGADGATFILALGEVARYTGSRDLRALTGPTASPAAFPGRRKLDLGRSPA